MIDMARNFRLAGYPPGAMATLKQITANRANAKRSTGPKTEEGKAASSQNALRHGILAQTICLEAEDKPRFEALVATFTAEFKPRNQAESELVEGLAIAPLAAPPHSWAIQKANFEIEMASIPESAGSAPIRAALAFRKLADQSQTLQLLQRYDTAYERQFNRAFNLLTKLRESASSEAAPAVPPDLPLPDLPFGSGTFPSEPSGPDPESVPTSDFSKRSQSDDRAPVNINPNRISPRDSNAAVPNAKAPKNPYD